METRTAVLPDRAAKQCDHPWLETLVATLDDRLRQHHGVFEYTRHPDCLFRIQIVAASGDFVLSDGVGIRAGDRLLGLHLWNERFPRFPADGPTLQWARRVNRGFDVSFRELAYFLALRREFDDIIAICGNMAFGSAQRSAQLARWAGGFGFERVATPNPRSLARQLHRFGENILISMMIAARNAAALRADTLQRDRLLVVSSRQKLQRRYGFARERAA
jgi:YkoP-like protein